MKPGINIQVSPYHIDNIISTNRSRYFYFHGTRLESSNEPSSQSCKNFEINFLKLKRKIFKKNFRKKKCQKFPTCFQAMDRAHWISQKKTVNVYRLITKDTVEEKIMSLQRFKLNIANTVVSADNSSMNTMSTGQLLDLFSLQRYV